MGIITCFKIHRNSAYKGYNRGWLYQIRNEVYDYISSRRYPKRYIKTEMIKWYEYKLCVCFLVLRPSQNKKTYCARLMTFMTLCHKTPFRIHSFIYLYKYQEYIIINNSVGLPIDQSRKTNTEFQRHYMKLPGSDSSFLLKHYTRYAVHAQVNQIR